MTTIEVESTAWFKLSYSSSTIDLVLVKNLPYMFSSEVLDVFDSGHLPVQLSFSWNNLRAPASSISQLVALLSVLTWNPLLAPITNVTQGIDNDVHFITSIIQEAIDHSTYTVANSKFYILPANIRNAIRLKNQLKKQQYNSDFKVGFYVLKVLL